MNVAGATGLRPAGPAERARTLYYIAAAVLAAMVPLILFAGLWVRAVLNQNDRDLRAYLVSHAEALSARLDQDVERQWSVLRAIALTPGLDGPDLAAFQATAERMVGVVPQWSALSVVDPASGRQLVSTLRPFGSDLPPLRNPEAARRVAETGRPAVLVRYPGESAIDERGGIFLAVPITRESGARLVLVAAVRAEAIQGVLEAVSEEGLLGVLVDERDRILARSQEPETFYGQPANAQLRNATAGRAAGLFAAETLDDTSVLTAYQRSSVTGWLAVLATDRARAHPSVDRSTWSVVAAGAIALTLAAALAVFLFYSVVERRVSDERYAASRALSALDARLLATTQEALAEQRKSASEREVLLREIYHRVKNNLQIIQSLLRLGSRDLEPGQREPFESAVRRIGAMARVHSLLYRSPDLASIDFKDYLEDLVDETADGFGADLRSIRTELEAQSMRVPLDTAVPLAFITVEILTNAFKHAFPHQRGGTVRVALRQEGENGVLTISDDGVGVPASDGGRKPLGLTLVRKLVEQVGGTLEPPEPGRSTYRVVFPLAPPPGSELPRLRPAGP